MWQMRSRLLGDTALMVQEFARQPRTVGAVAPSSRSLAEVIVAPIPLRGDPVVVELGPGTGAFTRVIQDRLHGRGRHLAIEVNPRLARVISERHSAVEVFESSASRLRRVLTESGLSGADLVVSGLPWAALPESFCDRTLDQVAGVLAPGGVFTTFGYSWVRGTRRARHFRRALTARFEEVVISRAVLRNLPPAFVYYARRPRA